MRYAVAHGRRSGRGGAAALGGRAVAGGDGAVGLAADLCAGTGTAVGILPAGTGNDNARSLGVPLEADGALRTLTAGHRRTVDTLRVVELGRRVLGSVDAGLDARIAHRATLLPRRLGAATYTAAALVEIARLRWTPPLRYTLTFRGADGATSTEELEALVVVPANLPYLGGGLCLAPYADPCDGLLDLVVIRPVSPARAVRLLRAVRAGRHTRLPEVQVRRVAEVRVEGPADVLAYGDGDALAPLPLTVRVQASDLRVIAQPLA